jgi:hypothetical protein
MFTAVVTLCPACFNTPGPSAGRLLVYINSGKRSITSLPDDNPGGSKYVGKCVTAIANIKNIYMYTVHFIGVLFIFLTH